MLSHAPCCVLSHSSFPFCRPWDMFLLIRPAMLPPTLTVDYSLVGLQPQGFSCVPAFTSLSLLLKTCNVSVKDTSDDVPPTCPSLGSRGLWTKAESHSRPVCKLWVLCLPVPSTRPHFAYTELTLHTSHTLALCMSCPATSYVFPLSPTRTLLSVLQDTPHSIPTHPSPVMRGSCSSEGKSWHCLV